MSACPQCGTVAKPADKFCNTCGTPIARGAPAPAAGGGFGGAPPYGAPDPYAGFGGAPPPAPGGFGGAPPPAPGGFGGAPPPAPPGPGGFGGGGGGGARCNMGHDIAPGASYCAHGHPIALDAMQFASDAYGPGGGGYGAPQPPPPAPGGGPYGPPQPPPAAGGYAPQGGQGFGGGFPDPSQQGYGGYGGAAPPPAAPAFGAPAQGYGPGGYGGQQAFAPPPAPAMNPGFGGPPQPPPQQPPPAFAPQQGFGQPAPAPAPFQPPPAAPAMPAPAAPPPYAPPGMGAPPGPAFTNDTSREAAPAKRLAGFLVAYQANPSGDFWPLTGGRHAVGRSGSGENIDIQLADPTISSRHAAVVVDPASGAITVEDTGSTNGTFVNEEHLGFNGRRELRDGDRVRFGGFTTIVKVIGRV